MVRWDIQQTAALEGPHLPQRSPERYGAGSPVRVFSWEGTWTRKKAAVPVLSACQQAPGTRPSPGMGQRPS